MRPSVLLAVAATCVALSPAAALAQGTEPAPPAADDPCAPVDGQAPLMCQSGPAGAPAGGPAELPRTGGTPYAEGALLLTAVGGGLVLLGRRRAG